MRNIIFTRIVSIATALAAVSAAAQAEPLLPLGCYARTYDAAHLSRNPAQIVENILLAIRYDAAYDSTLMPLVVTLADQGRAQAEGIGGRSFFQTLYCFHADGPADGPILCGVECDGGNFDVLRADATTLELRTDYVMVGDTGDCGGAVDLAEVPGQSVLYRLNRVEDALCTEIFP